MRTLPSRPLRPILVLALALDLVGLGCDVAPEPSPFAFDDDASDVAPPSSSNPVSEPEPDPEPDAPASDDAVDEPTLVAFVTSLAYTADLGGLQGADEICAFEAEAAQLPGTYRAWISDSITDAVDRIDADGPWSRVDGERIFNNRAQLRTAPLQPLDRDPYGDAVWASDVWTGTGAGGQWSGMDTCHGWSSEDDFSGAAAGQTVGGAEWTDSWFLPCSFEARLYCLQVQ